MIIKAGRMNNVRLIFVALLLAISSCNGKEQEEEYIPQSDFCTKEKKHDSRYTYDDQASTLPSGYEDLEIDYTAKNETDPLLHYQWHLANRGQKYVNGTSATTGNDINVKSVHNGTDGISKKIRGKGITVSVVDTGLEMKHEDLRTIGEYSFNFSYLGEEYEGIAAANDPSPVYERACDDHGTSVGGLIAAKSGNKLGGVGVAPSASLSGLNILGSYSSSLFHEAWIISLGLPGLEGNNAEEKLFKDATHADIFNYSLGNEINSYKPTGNNKYDEFFKQGVEQGRGGKGYVYVKAAGNEFFNCSTKDGTGDLGRSDELGISCVSSAQEESIFSPPYMFYVSATNSKGKLTSYSTTGSNVFVNAPSGTLHVFDISKVPNITRTDCVDDEANFSLCGTGMLTTDWMGCSRGYSRFDGYSNILGDPTRDSVNDFEFIFNESAEEQYKASAENSDCAYTSRFNGTSAATPVVSGVVALILEANPNLTWIDVGHVLANSSFKNDPDYKGIYFTYGDGILDRRTAAGNGINEANSSIPDAYKIEDKWMQNAAGYNFSNKYGFGRVDAKKAVETAMSTSYSFPRTSTLSEKTVTLVNSVTDELKDIKSITSTVFNSATDSTGNALASVVIDDSIKRVFNVELFITGAIQDAGNVFVRLTSPHGTQNIVLHPFTAWQGETDFNNISLVSNAFFGEAAAGKWYLEVYKVFPEDKAKITSAKLIVRGTD